jgi:small subunit ribosomal protein S1
VVKVGQKVEVRIIKIDTDERKIGLTLIQAHFEEGEEAEGGPTREVEAAPQAPTMGSLANQLKGIGPRVSAREAANKKNPEATNE